ncbi:hypothetical protein A1Q2_01094 [Trichosporon asahii var. asahii CBS 8904]|uniref:CCHC-type domain-containing protein n=1 Tax=Trichosporon asahii var. asahii (strain CBS 8904) TaxID=1220162 RepID=K1VVM3_TRIAC|nr:hypothetical protein A1Q2_01094 [Trichosporon asahii var. asahii CBS 8904]
MFPTVDHHPAPPARTVKASVTPSLSLLRTPTLFTGLTPTVQFRAKVQFHTKNLSQQTGETFPKFLKRMTSLRIDCLYQEDNVIFIDRFYYSLHPELRKMVPEPDTHTTFRALVYECEQVCHRIPAIQEGYRGWTASRTNTGNTQRADTNRRPQQQYNPNRRPANPTNTAATPGTRATVPAIKITPSMDGVPIEFQGDIRDPAVRAHLANSGRCFTCRKPGHTSRNCPDSKAPPQTNYQSTAAPRYHYSSASAEAEEPPADEEYYTQLFDEPDSGQPETATEELPDLEPSDETAPASGKYTITENPTSDKSIPPTPTVHISRPKPSVTATRTTGRELVEKQLKPRTFLVTLDVTVFAPPIKPDGQLDHDGPHEVIEAVALIDSGCTDNLISRRLVDSRSIPIRPMGQPKYPKLADGTRSSTPINEETAALRVRIGDHEEPLAFNVAPLPDYDIFLGAPWLSLHNPTINWTEGRITFDSEFCTEQCVPDKRMTQLPTSAQPQILKSCVAKLHFPSKSPDGKPLPRLKKMKPPKEVAQEIMALCATFLTSSDNPDSGQPDSSPLSPSTTATTTMPPSSTCCPDPVPPSESPPVKTPTYTVSPGTDMGDTCIGPSGEQSSFNVLFDDEDDMTPTQYLLHLAEVLCGPRLSS